eukprot:251578_1
MAHYSQDEEVGLTTKPSKPTTTYITNEVHIKSFKRSHSCCSHFYEFFCHHFVCCFKGDVFGLIGAFVICCVRLVLLLIGLSLIAAAVLSIMYGGYLVVLEGIHAQNYADSFDITGQCYLFGVDEEDTTPAGCSTDDDCSTSYTSYYDFSVIKDTETNSTSFPCEDGKEYSETENDEARFSEGQIVSCYTNAKCDNVYILEGNEHDRAATWIFVGAAAIFVVDLVCVIAFCAALCYGCVVWVALGCCVDDGGMRGHECSINCYFLTMCCRCGEYRRETTERKEKYYRTQWDGTGNMEQCDYILANWTRSERISLTKNRISNDILEIVVGYYQSIQIDDVDVDEQEKRNIPLIRIQQKSMEKETELTDEESEYEESESESDNDLMNMKQHSSFGSMVTKFNSDGYNMVNKAEIMREYNETGIVLGNSRNMRGYGRDYY